MLMKGFWNAGLSPLARGTRHDAGRLPVEPRFIPAGAGNTSRPRAGRRRTAVYPRWCGEHRVQSLVNGLSPLARGTLYAAQQYPQPARFIPAGAGNTKISLVAFILVAVYPRWRGEHRRGFRPARPHHGLSPLARGTLPMSAPATRTNRFILAGAGNTPPRSPHPAGNSVYPRWRGEHRTAWIHINSRLRFIPAGAGNTCYR